MKTVNKALGAAFRNNLMDDGYDLVDYLTFRRLCRQQNRHPPSLDDYLRHVPHSKFVNEAALGIIHGHITGAMNTDEMEVILIDILYSYGLSFKICKSFFSGF